MTPCTDMDCANRPLSRVWLGFQAGTRPSPGLTVTAPFADAGNRREPPMSFPCANAPMPAITEAPAPPDDPPAETWRPHGLCVRPNSGLSVSARNENSGVLVRPMMTAPAALRLATTGASSGAITSLKAATPLLVAWPFWSTLILIVTGTPCSGPLGCVAGI